MKKNICQWGGHICPNGHFPQYKYTKNIDCHLKT